MDTKQLLEAVEAIKAIKPLFDAQKNEWLPVIAAIGGAFVGGVSTFLPNYLLALSKHKKEQRSVTNALISEISGLMVIVEHRQYIQGFKKVADGLRSNPSSTFKYCVKIPDHYSRVYQSHVGRLGIIEPEIASKIIEFHQLIDSIVQDIGPGGIISEKGGNLLAFEELIKIAESAMLLGNELTLKFRTRSLVAAQPVNKTDRK